MNAGAYGSDWSEILVRALVATADGRGWLTPAELGLSYRHSSLHHGQVVAAVEYRLDAARRERDPGDRARSRRAPQGDTADDEAHLRLASSRTRRASSAPGR